MLRLVLIDPHTGVDGLMLVLLPRQTLLLRWGQLLLVSPALLLGDEQVEAATRVG